MVETGRRRDAPLPAETCSDLLLVVPYRPQPTWHLADPPVHVRVRGLSETQRGSSDVDPSQVRAWAEENGFEISPRGRIKSEIVEAFKTAHA